ncbi:L domain-like protein [Phanerochaete sordida]|uniref:L domain-like protein n=1 Tax=Phanerochaete sordida TaxID=48140 RepID=A0A9P3G8S4_9APHY|nr:L domain-like protein [Phanerochaete sordida]
MSTSTPSTPRQSTEYSSRFKEHLSITIPPPGFAVESSRFSPDSESPPPRPSRTLSDWTNASTVRSFTPTRPAPIHTTSKDSDAHSVPPSVAPSHKSRIGRLFFDIRALTRDREPEIVPIDEPALHPWPPLHIEKRACCHDCPCHTQSPARKKRKQRRRRILTALLVLVLLYLLGNVAALNTRVFAPSRMIMVNGTVPATPGLSAAAQQCLDQFTVNAPADPAGYPCSTCLPTLQAVPSGALSSGDSQDSQSLLNAVQFCGLRAIFETSDSSGQAALKGGNWDQDVKFCAWSGVSCDGSGRVSSLSLTFPGVPAALPNELGALSGLQSLTVVGNSVIPAGSLPSNFTAWTSLGTLHLESTAITSVPDNIFSVAKSLSTLTLVKNGQMSTNLPSSITSSSLQNLIVNNQDLANALPQITSSSSLQASLKLLDLSSTFIFGAIPSSISSFSSLVELHLDSNNLATPIPATFPGSLQVLSLANNTGLVGNVFGSFCALGNLQTCNMQNTGLTAPSGCGVCQFLSAPVSALPPAPSSPTTVSS